MSILNNGVEAIQVGLEDFKSHDHRRAHSALRNIFAGILLLFKEKLSRLSPKGSDEVLIRQHIVPILDKHGNLGFQGKGYKTVDVQQIKERFSEFKIKVDWTVLDKINKLRNNIEHYYTEEPPAIVNEVVAKSFKIIRDFCIKHLDVQPVELFGSDSWNIFLEADEIYETEKDESLKALSQIDWTYDTLKFAVAHLRCPTCGSDLIHPLMSKKYQVLSDFPLTCKKCQEEFELDDIIEECIEEELSAAAHVAVMDGGESPYAECPECLRSTFIYNEGCCLSCGYAMPEKTCTVCGTPLDLEMAHEGRLCSYHRWVMEKADED